MLLLNNSLFSGTEVCQIIAFVAGSFLQSWWSRWMIARLRTTTVFLEVDLLHVVMQIIVVLKTLYEYIY